MEIKANVLVVIRRAFKTGGHAFDVVGEHGVEFEHNTGSEAHPLDGEVWEVAQDIVRDYYLPEYRSDVFITLLEWEVIKDEPIKDEDELLFEKEFAVPDEDEQL